MNENSFQFNTNLPWYNCNKLIGCKTPSYLLYTNFPCSQYETLIEEFLPLNYILLCQNFTLANLLVTYWQKWFNMCVCGGGGGVPHIGNQGPTVNRFYSFSCSLNQVLGYPPKRVMVQTVTKETRFGVLRSLSFSGWGGGGGNDGKCIVSFCVKVNNND